MRKDNRKFCASIYVRNGEQRVKLELSPASQHGGPEGFYRVRVERRWLNTEDGRPRWFDRDFKGNPPPIPQRIRWQDIPEHSVT